MFDLPHVAARLYGTPLLVSATKLDAIMAVMDPRLRGEKIELSAPDKPSGPAGFEITDAGIAILPVMGTLVRRTSVMSAVCGFTTYQGLEASAEEAFTDPNVQAVLMDIDSCGGEASGLFDLVASLRSMSVSTGKPLWAIANEAALSAAYGIACAAERIWLPRTGEAGSVGVVALHVDESKADEKAGLAYTYIHAGARKVDANPHEPLADDVKARLQADVDVLYDQFAALVAECRHCSEAAIRATEASIYRGQAAVSAGLADAVGTFRQAHEALATFLDRKTAQTAVPATFNIQEEHMALETLNTEKPLAAPADRPAPEPDMATLMAEAEASVCERMTELSEISAQAKRIGVSIDPVQALKNGIQPDALRRQVLEQAAARDVADVVAVAPDHEKPANDNRLLNAVKKMHRKESE